MKKLSLILIAIFIHITVYSAYLKNVPIDLKQPDGLIINCFITGDEFHRRIHDKDNYTIIQDSETGFYVYALLDNGTLVTSENIVGKCEPSQLALEPNVDIPCQKIEQIRTTQLKSAKIVTENSTKGNFNNIVIFIRFSDQIPSILTLSNFENLFNSTTGISLKSFYKEVSNSQLNVSSSFYPLSQNQTILEYQDVHPRSYYTPYDAILNPIGYVGQQGNERETVLIKSAIEFVANQILNSNLNIDSNNDGFVDNLTFIIQGNVDYWGNILWPSSTSLKGFQIFIGDKEVSQYNKQFSNMLTVSVLSHEFFHSLGAPDLYRYYDKRIDPIGSWDIMGGSSALHMSTYMKWKYGKWINTLPEITQPGSYSLLPVSTSTFACYKINSPDNIAEYFVVEYRKREGLLEASIPENYDSGLIIYRINTKVATGNIEGPPDEVYVYRLGGTNNVNGDISKAAFSLNMTRSAFNDLSNPSCFLSNGSKGWIDISNISTADDKISFTVNPVKPLYKPRNLSSSLQNNQVLLKWNMPLKKSDDFRGFNIYLGSDNLPLNTEVLNDTIFLTSIPGPNTKYSFKVTAMYQQGESESTSCYFINESSPARKDSLALVALYNQCNGPNWTRKANWLVGPLNTWQGIWTENNRVTAIDLGSEDKMNSPNPMTKSVGLTGKLPVELSDLTELTFLSFFNNQLTGTLPESWSALVKLRELWLNYNQLSGELPEKWESLVNLQWLYLSNNHFTGPLPAKWSALQNLAVLNLDFNELSGEIPVSWFSLMNIQWLFLGYNNLSGTLREDWTTLKKLRSLELSKNQFSGNLPENWSSLVQLETISLGQNQFTGNLPDSWSKLINLYSISLNGNQITGPLPESWSSLKNLSAVFLQMNQLSGNLPKSWSSMVKLNTLMLYNNQLTGPLPESWSSFINLQIFDLQQNQLSGSLPAKWSSMTRLTYLNLSSNNLSESLPASWSKLKNLTLLSLGRNQLSGAFPLSWLEFKNLENLNISRNKITSLPDLSALTKLNYLFIAENNLDFGGIEPNMKVAKLVFSYDPQDPYIGMPDTLVKKPNEEFRVSLNVGGKSNKYLWLKNGNPIIGADQKDYVIPSVKKSDAGDYTCAITNTVVPQVYLKTLPITLKVEDATLNSEVSAASLKVFPNPSKGLITIEGLSSTQINEITIQSLDGKLIKKKDTYLAIESIDMSDQAPGTYLLRINNQSFKIQKK